LLGKPLPVYGDGLQVRDWLHVEDHCAAIALALRRGRPGEVYNIGGNSETTNIEIVRTLCGLVDEAFGERAALRAAFPNSPAVGGKRAVDLITHVRDRLGHDRRYAIDYRKAGRELGYAPGRDLAAGLRQTLDWYLAEVPWWQALLGRDYAEWVEKNYKR
jgi:dTDP-glucose 4,6-dehydratase